MSLSIALVYPELLGTYGDGGNALILRSRAQWRGIDAAVVEVPAGSTLPTSCDVYLLGGGEDEPQTLAAQGISRGGALATAVSSGAVVLAVCAGFQVLGESFVGSDGREAAGAGLLGCVTRRSLGDGPVPPRAVGDLAVAPTAFELPLLVGYENHGGRTTITRGRPLGNVVQGVGNGTPDRAEGLVDGRIVATYLHGPVLAQNPALADLLLAWAVGVEPSALPPLDRPEPAEGLRRARFAQLGL